MTRALALLVMLAPPFAHAQGGAQIQIHTGPASGAMSRSVVLADNGAAVTVVKGRARSAAPAAADPNQGFIAAAGQMGQCPAAAGAPAPARPRVVTVAPRGEAARFEPLDLPPLSAE